MRIMAINITAMIATGTTVLFHLYFPTAAMGLLSCPKRSVPSRIIFSRSSLPESSFLSKILTTSDNLSMCPSKGGVIASSQ